MTQMSFFKWFKDYCDLKVFVIQMCFFMILKVCYIIKVYDFKGFCGLETDAQTADQQQRWDACHEQPKLEMI